MILKEAGVTMIHQKYFEEKERQLLLLEYEDGAQEAVSGFYRVKSLPEGQKIEPSALKELLAHPYRESANTAKTDVATI